MPNRSIPRPQQIGFLFAIACVSAGICVSAFAQDRSAEAQRHYQAGQRAQAVGSYTAAIQEYLKVVAILPQAAEAYASLGLAYNAEDKFTESAQALEKAKALKPGLKGVSLYLGIDLVKLNRAAAAIAYLKEATRLEPANKQAWLWLGTAWFDSGHNEEAISSLRRANDLFPSDPDVLFHLGEAYRSAADAETQHVLFTAVGQPLAHQVYGDIYKDEHLWAKASGHYHRALAEDGRWQGAHLGLGEIALRQGNLDEAKRELSLELEVDPRSASAQAELAQISLLKADSRDALAALERAIEFSPSRAAYSLGLPPEAAAVPAPETGSEALRGCLPDLVNAREGPARSLALAFVYRRLGMRGDSLSHWNDFKRSVPAERTANGYEAALTQFYFGNLAEAETVLRAWIRGKPNDLQASYTLARTERRLSLSALGQLLAVAPESYPAHTLLAETYENAEDYEKAIVEYRKVEQMAPALPGVHYALGHLLAKTGDPDQAVDDFRQELRINPDYAAADAELGALLVESDEQAQGLAYLKRAVALDPDLWIAHRALGQAYFKLKNFAMAESELQKAVDHDPDGSAHYQLGRVYRALGRTVDARNMLAEAQRIETDQLADASAARALPESNQP